MITVVMQFDLPEPLLPAAAAARFKISAQKYAKIPGLIRKYFSVASDGNSGAGIYLWESRAAAESCFTETWLNEQELRFGSKPNLLWLECPVVVDNALGEIVIDEAYTDS